MKKDNLVSEENLSLFLELNERLRHATAHSETEFFSQFTDISLLHAHMVLVINFHQPCKMSDIAKAMNFSLGAVTQAIDKLEKKKYVKRVRSKTDRRVIYIELCAKGRKVVTANEHHVKKVGAEIMKKFTQKEQKQFLSFFARMAED